MIEQPSKKRILILGQIPPPYGGQAINIQKMVQVLAKHQFNYRLIPLDFSEGLNDMGAFNFTKLTKLVHFFYTSLSAIGIPSTLGLLSTSRAYHKCCLQRFYIVVASKIVWVQTSLSFSCRGFGINLYEACTLG